MHVMEATRFSQLFWPEFVENEGCLFLARDLPLPRLSLATFQDATAVESLHNHVHILDEFEHGAALDGTDPSRGYYDAAHPDFMAACEAGKQIAAMWHAKLMLEYPDRRTRVYFTADDDPIVRFHCVRPNEPAWLDESGWQEQIRLERVLVLDSAVAPRR